MSYKQASTKGHNADMSLPPEQRGRGRQSKGKGRKGVIAQMDHASGSPEINDLRRKWDKKNKRRNKRVLRQSERK